MRPREHIRSPLLIHLSFEQANGETFVRDHGSAGAAWTLSGGATQQTGTVLDGSASLQCAWATSGVCSTPYSRHIAIGPNDDFEVEMSVRCSDWNAGGAGKTFCIIGGTGVFGDSVMIMSSSSTDAMFFSISNGSALQTISTAGGIAVDNERMRMAYGRRGSFMYIRKDGGLAGSASGVFSGRIANYPAATFRIGHPGYAQFGTPTIQFDEFKFWRYDSGQRHFVQRNG